MDRSSTGETGNDERFAASASRSTTGSQDGTRAVDQAKDTVKQELRSAREDVQRRAADNVNRQKHRVADRLDSIVHALNAAKNSLEEDDQGQLAKYVSDLTHQVERSTGYLRNNDYGAMMRDMENVARNNTGVFLGSTFAAGLAMGRFLRASEPEEGELQGGDWRSQVAGGRSFAGEPGGSYGSSTGASYRGAGDIDSTSYRAASSDSAAPSHPGSTDIGYGGSTYGTSGFQANTFGSYADRGTQAGSSSAREIAASDALRGGAGTGRDRDLDLEPNANRSRGREFDHGQDATRRAAQRDTDDQAHRGAGRETAFDRDTGTQSDRGSTQNRGTRREGQ
jgi:hypothetical protein